MSKSLTRGKESNQCLLRTRFSTKPILTPYPPLSICRVEKMKPFDTTGLEFAGPLYEVMRGLSLNNAFRTYHVCCDKSTALENGLWRVFTCIPAGFPALHCKRITKRSLFR